jgi:hypothetical protein
MKLSNTEEYLILTFHGNDTGRYSSDDKEDDSSPVVLSSLAAGGNHRND